MRIAWLSPGSPRSAIGRYSREVVRALSQYATVDLWPLGDPEWLESSSRGAPLRRAVERLGSYDVIVHNLGDNLLYHRDVYELSRLWGGVVVVHDRSLNNFFLSYYQRHLRDLGTYLEHVRELYGRDLEALAAKYASGQLGSSWAENPDLQAISFQGEALAGQQAAVVHSQVHANEVARCWPGPCLAIPFPTYPELLAEPEPVRIGDRVTLVTAGWVNPNRRIHDVLAVLKGDRDLASHVRYLIAGPASHGNPYRRTISDAVSESGLEGTVTLLGEQPTSRYREILRTADVHINLRHPSLEGGSASAAEQLASGRPLVVHDTGSFSELPDEVAIKVPPGDLDSLHSALGRLVFDPGLRAEMGAAARREAESRSVERYARELFRFLESLPRSPWNSIRDRVGTELSALGVEPGSVGHQQVDRELACLLPRSR